MIKTHENEENNKLGESDSENEGENKKNEEIEEEEMAIKPVSKYYKNRQDAEKNRRRGDRIYHKPSKGFYIRRPTPKEKTIWEKILGW